MKKNVLFHLIVQSVLLCTALCGDSGVQSIEVKLPAGTQPPGTHPVAQVVNGVLKVDFVPNQTSSTSSTSKKSSTTASASATPQSGAVTSSGSAQKPKDLLSSVNFDRAPGAVPAFDALGLSPETVSQPTSPRDLAASLLSGVDHNGVLQNGVAIETAPFRLLPSFRSDIDTYRKDPLTRLLYNFSFSLATSKASDKSDAVQLALGFSTILYQDEVNDPYRNPDFKAAFDKVNTEHPVTGVPWDGTLPDEDPVAKQTLQAAADEFHKKSWVGTIWSASIAPTWTSSSGKASDLSSTGFTVWSNFAYGLADPVLQIGSNDPIQMQFLGQIRYRQGELVVDSQNQNHSALQNSFIAAGRLRLGTTDFNGFGEGGYVRIWHGLNGGGDGWRAAGGIEKKLSENMWLVISAGEQFGGAATKENEMFAIGSIRFGTSDSPQFAPGSQ